MKSYEPYYFSTAFAAFSLAIILIVGFNTSETETDNYDDSEQYVLSTFSSDGEAKVNLSMASEITLSETIDFFASKGITFYLMHENETVPGTLSFDKNKGFFTPKTNLKPETHYTAVFSMPGHNTGNDINNEYPYEHAEPTAKPWNYTSADN